MISEQTDTLLNQVKKIRYPDDEPIDTKSRQALNSGEFIELPASIKEFVDLNIHISNPQIGAKENPEPLRNALVKISTTQGGLLNEKCMRAALDLVCVVDISGSMIGFNDDGTIGTNGKIDRLKTTLNHLLDFLTDADRFSLVYFTSKAKRATKLLNVTKANKELFRQQISSVQAGGSTNIFEGLLHGLSVLDSRREKNQVSSVFLLSDGCDKLSHAILQDTFTKQRGYDSFADISINTFGFGDDDCNLMELIAHKSGGVFYNVDEYENYIECFVECLGSLLSIIADKALLKVKLLPTKAFPEINFSKVLSESFERPSELEVSLDYKFLISGMTKNLVFSIHLPISKEIESFIEKEVIIAEAVLTFSSISNGETFSISKQLTVRVEKEPGVSSNEEVERQALRMELALFQKNQVELVDKGNFEEAKRQEQLFEQNHLKRLAQNKNDALLSKCYAQYNQTQTYVQGYSGSSQNHNEKQKRKLVSAGYSMKNECSNIGNRYYCNQIQARMLDHLK